MEGGSGARGPRPRLRSADLYRVLRQRGKTIRSMINCVIAVFAEERGCAVLACNRDMRTLLESGLLTVRGGLIEGLSSWPPGA